jgi:hypothetical protein
MDILTLLDGDLWRAEAAAGGLVRAFWKTHLSASVGTEPGNAEEIPLESATLERELTAELESLDSEWRADGAFNHALTEALLSRLNRR